jgi:hypothetical protein
MVSSSGNTRDASGCRTRSDLIQCAIAPTMHRPMYGSEQTATCRQPRLSRREVPWRLGSARVCVVPRIQSRIPCIPELPSRLTCLGLFVRWCGPPMFSIECSLWPRNNPPRYRQRRRRHRPSLVRPRPSRLPFRTRAWFTAFSSGRRHGPRFLRRAEQSRSPLSRAPRRERNFPRMHGAKARPMTPRFTERGNAPA